MHRSIESINKGFTLLETMTVVAVISIILSGAISLYFSNIQDAHARRDTMILKQLNTALDLYILNDGDTSLISNNLPGTNEYVVKTLLKNYIEIPRNNIAFDRLYSQGTGNHFYFYQYGEAVADTVGIHHLLSSHPTSPWASVLPSESTHPTNLSVYGEEYWTPQVSPGETSIPEDILEPIISHFL